MRYASVPRVCKCARSREYIEIYMKRAQMQDGISFMK